LEISFPGPSAINCRSRQLIGNFFSNLAVGRTLCPKNITFDPVFFLPALTFVRQPTGNFLSRPFSQKLSIQAAHWNFPFQLSCKAHILPEKYYFRPGIFLAALTYVRQPTGNFLSRPFSYTLSSLPFCWSVHFCKATPPI